MATFLIDIMFSVLNYTPPTQRTLKFYMIRFLFLFRCFAGNSSHKYVIRLNNSKSSVNDMIVLRIIYSTWHGWAVKCKPLHVKRSLYGTWYTLNMAFVVLLPIWYFMEVIWLVTLSFWTFDDNKLSTYIIYIEHDWALRTRINIGK